jgi:hypothetical protein
MQTKLEDATEVYWPPRSVLSPAGMIYLESHRQIGKGAPWLGKVWGPSTPEKGGLQKERGCSGRPAALTAGLPHQGGWVGFAVRETDCRSVCGQPAMTPAVDPPPPPILVEGDTVGPLQLAQNVSPKYQHISNYGTHLDSPSGQMLRVCRHLARSLSSRPGLSSSPRWTLSSPLLTPR